jgi:hypothetical protein
MYMAFLDVILKYSAEGKIDTDQFIEDARKLFGETHPDLFREIVGFATPTQDSTIDPIDFGDADINSTPQVVIPAPEQDAFALLPEVQTHQHEVRGPHHEIPSVHGGYYASQPGSQSHLPQFDEIETNLHDTNRYSTLVSPTQHDSLPGPVTFMYQTHPFTRLIDQSTQISDDYANENQQSMYSSDMLRITPTQYSAMITNGQFDTTGYSTSFTPMALSFSASRPESADAVMIQYPKVGMFGVGANPTSREFSFPTICIITKSNLDIRIIQSPS